MNKKIVIIGGGVAGMEAASNLSTLGFDIVILEKTEKLGGNLLKWAQLFPSRRPGSEVTEFLNKGMRHKNITVHYNAAIEKIEKNNNQFFINLKNVGICNADIIIVATGYDLFDGSKKEEYGYGIYDNVITSADLEKIFAKEKLRNYMGKIPERIGIVHCVGSRDEKAGNYYCSKVCCITAVKQAIEIKEKLPFTDVYCFYMDMRMYGPGFEEMYREAQEKWGVNFIRGRVSEASENVDNSILIKVEDTLVGRPLKMSVDLLVLMVGMVPSKGTRSVSKLMGLEIAENGFIKSKDEHTMSNLTNIPGVFIAGSCKEPMSITDTITDARAVSLQVVNYLKKIRVKEEISLYN